MRVFISYSHDSDAHRARVKKLAERLRNDRVSVILDSDCLPGGPSEGWPAWSEAQVRDAERTHTSEQVGYAVFETPFAFE